MEAIERELPVDHMRAVEWGDDEECLIVFVRVPRPGHTKTRLAQTIGDEMAVALYRCFVADTLAVAARSGHRSVCFFEPPEARKAAVEWLGRDTECSAQQGDNLGERMAAAFRTTFGRYRRVVLIGSDCPDLPEDFLPRAFDSLRYHDAVIGPTGDGGYCLIGFTDFGFDEMFFRGVEWGSLTVFDTTMALFSQRQLKVHVLPQWYDIDEYRDLEAFGVRHKDVPRGVLLTLDFVRTYLAVPG